MEQAGHYPFLDQPLVFLGQVLRQTAAAFPHNAAAAAARAAAAAATPVTAATPQQISEWLDQWCGSEWLPQLSAGAVAAWAICYQQLAVLCARSAFGLSVTKCG